MTSYSARVLVIGCGNIAGGFDMARPGAEWPLTHAGAFVRHGGFKILACVDPDAARREAFAKHWMIPRHAETLASLDSHAGSFDVISVCSPTVCHLENLQAALALSPRVIFCEKPLTSSLEATRQFLQACTGRGVALVLNYTRQWDPSVQRLVDEIKSGHWGKIRSVACFYNKGVLNNGGHMIELLLRLLGPMAVVAATSPVHDFWADDPVVAALLRSEEHDVPVTLNPSHAMDYSYFEMEIVCEKGVVRMRDGGLQWEIRRATSSKHFKGYTALSEAQSHGGAYMQAMTLAVAEIYDFLAHGHSLRSGGELALAVHLLCDQLLAASRPPTH